MSGAAAADTRRSAAPGLLAITELIADQTVTGAQASMTALKPD